MLNCSIFQLAKCHIVVLISEMVDYMYLANLAGTILFNGYCDI
jgi:hypothetical protein